MTSRSSTSTRAASCSRTNATARSPRRPAEVPRSRARLQGAPARGQGEIPPVGGEDALRSPSDLVGTFLPVTRSPEPLPASVCGVTPVSRRAIDAVVRDVERHRHGDGRLLERGDRRARTPVDVALDSLHWWQLMTERRAPRWASRHRIVRRGRLTRLRDFTPSRAGRRRADARPAAPGRPRLVHRRLQRRAEPDATILAAGLERLYALDWIGARRRPRTRRSTTTSRCDAAVRGRRRRPGQPVGDCQGGWLADDLRGAAPRARQHAHHRRRADRLPRRRAVIHECVEALATATCPSTARSSRTAAACSRASSCSAASSSIKPENEVGRQLQLLAHVRDARPRRALPRVRGLVQAHPGHPGRVLPLDRRAPVPRQRARSRELRDRRRAVDLGRIDCPLNLLGGATDHITPPEQVFALADHAPRRPSDGHERTTSGGHLGLFMGTEALRDHWPVVMASVLEHSRPGADGAARVGAPLTHGAPAGHPGAVASPRARAGARAAPGAPARRRRGRPRAAPGAGGRSVANRRGRLLDGADLSALRRRSSRPARRARRGDVAAPRRSHRVPARTARAGRARSGRGTDSRCRPGVANCRIDSSLISRWRRMISPRRSAGVPSAIASSS